MIELKLLKRKMVRILDIEGKTFEGVVCNYIFPQDKIPEGIMLEYPIRDDGYEYKDLVFFNVSDIKSIEVIE